MNDEAMKTSGCSNRSSRVKLSRRGICALPRRPRNTQVEAGVTKSVKGRCLGRRHVGDCHINWLLSFQTTTLLCLLFNGRFSIAETQRRRLEELAPTGAAYCASIV